MFLFREWTCLFEHYREQLYYNNGLREIGHKVDQFGSFRLVWQDHKCASHEVGTNSVDSNHSALNVSEQMVIIEQIHRFWGRVRRGVRVEWCCLENLITLPLPTSLYTSLPQPRGQNCARMS